MKYSVIIPVYNAEGTLERCLSGLTGEAYPCAELLLIDDGSTDSSAAICRRYAAADSRIRFLQKENGGVSSARNLGLSQARGEFILFVDSDDYVTPGCFSCLDRTDPEGLYDYLLFPYHRFDGIRESRQDFPAFSSRDPEAVEPMLAHAYTRKWTNAPWAKRYRRAILEENGIRFHTDLPIAEDTLFNLQYLLRCRSLCIGTEAFYTVSLENPGSLSRKPLAHRQELLALAEREMEAAIAAAPISPRFRGLLELARNALALSDIYSEAKQLHLAGAALLARWRTLLGLCRAFGPRPLPDDRRTRLLAIPVKARLIPVIDLLGKKLSK